MKKKSFIPILLFQFFIFFSVNQAFGQEEKNCRDFAKGKLSIIQCTHKEREVGQIISYGGQKYRGSGIRYVSTMQYSLDGGEMKHIHKIQQLEHILTSVPESKFFYDRIFWGKRIRKYGAIGGIAAGIISIAISPDGSNPTVETIGGTLLLAGLLVPRFLSSTRKDFMSSIEAYNQAAKKTSLLKSLKPDYLTLGNAQGTAGISIGWHLGR